MSWQFFSYKIAGNELWRLLLFFGVILLSMIVGRLARLFVDRASSHALAAKQDWLGIVLQAVSRPLIVLSLAGGLWLSVALNFLKLSEGPRSVMFELSHILNAVAFGYAIYCFVDVIDHYLKNLAVRTESKIDDFLAPLLGKSIRITVSILVILNIVQVVSGKSITTILAGLGVGGLAVAFAAQDTIKNFFGSLVILGDRPFEIGDRVVIEDHDGSVEHVGFRSTKIRTLNGHLVTVPNSEIVSKIVQNIGQRPYIRRIMNITITYDTPPEKVQRALEIARGILDDHEGMNPDFPPRVFFNEFNDCSLNIIAIYWYHPPDYWQYMAFSEKVNQLLLERFNEEGIEFAFPTQTLYLANDEKRQLALKMLREQS